MKLTALSGTALSALALLAACKQEEAAPPVDAPTNEVVAPVAPPVAASAAVEAPDAAASGAE